MRPMLEAVVCTILLIMFVYSSLIYRDVCGERCLWCYVYVYVHANWLFGFPFGYTLANIISLYVSCSMHI